MAGITEQIQANNKGKEKKKKVCFADNGTDEVERDSGGVGP